MKYVTREDDISVLPFSTRIVNSLKRAKICTIGDMLDFPQNNKWHNIRNLGKKGIAEIKDWTINITNGYGDYLLVDTTQTPVTPEDPTSTAENTSFATVFMDRNGNLVEDISINELNLPIRAKNSLRAAGFKYASEIVDLTISDLLSCRNMGNKTADAIIQEMSKIRVDVQLDDGPLAYTEDSPDYEIAAELTDAFGRSDNIWLSEIMTIKEQYPTAQAETVLYRLFDTENVRTIAKSVILNWIQESSDIISWYTLSSKFPVSLYNTTIPEELLVELENDEMITVSGDLYSRRYPTVVEFCYRLEDFKYMQILSSRLNGETFQEIGKKLDLTRERVRQLQQKILAKRPRLAEDKYIYIFNTYDFSLADFCLAFDEQPETYHYLEMIENTKRADRKPISEILTDDSISYALRKRAEKAIYKDYVFIDGIQVKKSRPDLVRFAVQRHCQKLTKYDDFTLLYNELLCELGLDQDDKLTIDTRTYENILSSCDYTLWHTGKKFRYYNFTEHDFDAFLAEIDFDAYNNLEISTQKLILDYPEMMLQYDIHDEYELHSLLRKITPEGSNTRFGRMPNIEIGNVDRNAQVFALLKQYAPITADEFAEIYEASYGVRKTTVLANYLKDFSIFLHGNTYSLEVTDIPQAHLDRLKNVLDKDFYSVEDVKRIYLREFPNADTSLITSYVLKLLGFRVYPASSGYVVKNTYDSAASYFNALLTQNDIVDLRNFSSFLINLSTFNAVLINLKSNRQIIEFQPKVYINIRRLNSNGVYLEDLEDYCASASRFVEPGTYFTIHSIHNQGFSHDLDDLGFSDWFYASLLTEDKKNFSYRRIAGRKLFYRGTEDVLLSDLLVDILLRETKIEMYDLIELFETEYDLRLSRTDIISKYIPATTLHYDSIMDTVYVDYDTYFEEI